MDSVYVWVAEKDYERGNPINICFNGGENTIRFVPWHYHVWV